MLDQLKLKTKISLLVVAALLGLVSLVVLSAFQTKTDLINGRKEVIRSVLEGISQLWPTIMRKSFPAS